MNITIPVDRRGHPIQTLAPDVTASVGFGASSGPVALPTDAELVRIAVTQDCFMEFGTSGVVASGSTMYMPKGSEIFRVPDAATHVAFIQANAGGTASVTRMV